MRMQKITKHLAAGLLLAGVTIPLASCVDDSYDMSKDIDMTMGIGSEGLKIKLGSTEKIMLADILETDGNLQTDSKNKYYLVEGGETSVNFTVSTVNAMLDNATLCPSYEVLKYDDIVPEELKGQPFEVEAGRVFDLDAPISAETEFDFDIDNIHEDVKWLKVIRPTAETSQLKFFLEIEQSAMDGIAFDASLQGGDEITKFYQGALKMAFCWNIAQQLNPNTANTGEGLTQNGEEIAFMSFPSQDGTAKLNGGIWGFGIFDNGDQAKIDAAKTFIDFICNDPDQVNESVKASTYFPVRPTLTGIYDGTDTADVMNTFSTHFMPSMGDYYQVVPGWAEARTEWWNMLQRIGTGGDVATEVETFVTNANAAAAK